ncbi:enoyl-CoA hydratase-related protein [Chelatococcus reniformis]|uniref:Enoyl-CoA hydratase n=1 Tax=Chelatococcus reniformis TaxID=1494448 RepID=A0A916UFQ0_9HYPH|nr:enoyl-CoA hydratase-related protein [Chelatococcus reniformis]GGC71930.1 enoyl-CoA hydratase [Chelatococcus reniformis]
MTGLVSYERRGPLGLIRLERPDALNALTHEMIADVELFARAAERDADVLAICITGAGRGFCAGLDISVLAAQTGAEGVPTLNEAEPRPALFSFLLDISKPVIGAINGVGAGGGFVLAMMCDLRFMAEEATLTTVFSRRGLIAEHATSWLLPRIVGLSRALDLLWSSRRIDAAEAYRVGFADRVVPADRLLDAVEAYVADMAATVSPRALAVMKAQVHRDVGRPFAESVAETHHHMIAALRSADAGEGARSFVERRPPRFAAWTGEDK